MMASKECWALHLSHPRSRHGQENENAFIIHSRPWCNAADEMQYSIHSGPHPLLPSVSTSTTFFTVNCQALPIKPGYDAEWYKDDYSQTASQTQHPPHSLALLRVSPFSTHAPRCHSGCHSSAITFPRVASEAMSQHCREEGHKSEGGLQTKKNLHGTLPTSFVFSSRIWV